MNDGILIIAVIVIFFIFKKEIIEIFTLSCFNDNNNYQVKENYENSGMVCIGDICLNQNDLNLLIINSIKNQPTSTTTQVPITTTQSPVTTTQAPITTTQSPVTTTQAPITTTQVPITTTQVPITTTQVPITTTQVPVTTTQPLQIISPEVVNKQSIESEIQISKIITDETPNYKTVADLFGITTPPPTTRPPITTNPPMTTQKPMQPDDITFLLSTTTPPPISTTTLPPISMTTPPPIFMTTPPPISTTTPPPDTEKLIQTKLQTEISILPILTNTTTGYKTIGDLMGF